MPILDDRDHLFDKIPSHSIQNLFKEWLVMVQVIAEPKLWLKFFPNLVILSRRGRRFEREFLPQPIIKLLRIFPILAQSIDFDIAFFGAAVGRDMEVIILLGVVNAILVRKFEEQVNARASSQMSVMHGWFRHNLQTLVEG